MKPLVSILIPAYNSSAWISETIESALAQTWPRKEIIIVDDGSKDSTFDVARRFTSKQLNVVRTENQGAAAARNHAYNLAQGDYIQWLDADDLLSPEKIEKQLSALRETDTNRTLLSCPWGFFIYRKNRAHFRQTSLYHDLSPIDWLTRKLGENLHMQTATWLTSRELSESAGCWDTRLLSDDDGEYFCRVLLASTGTRFVPDAKVYYRMTSSGRLSHIGSSDRKKNSMLVSMKLHLQYIRSLEDSDRVRKACLHYLQTWYVNFYPERPDIVEELQRLASELGGQLVEPHLRWKYAWLKPLFGWHMAKWAQNVLPLIRVSWTRRIDKLMYQLESSRQAKSSADHH